MKKGPAHNKGKKEPAGKREPAAKKEPEGKREAPGTQPIVAKEDVQQSNDEHIDQDFPGYPHHPSKDKIIHNGSAGAFDATEQSLDESDENDEDQEMGDRKY